MRPKTGRLTESLYYKVRLSVPSPLPLSPMNASLHPGRRIEVFTLQRMKQADSRLTDITPK